MNFILTFIIVGFSLLSFSGCGGGGGGSASGTTNIGLPAGSAQTTASNTNQSVLNIVQRSSAFFGSAPSASVQRIAYPKLSKDDPRALILKAFGFSVPNRSNNPTARKSISRAISVADQGNIFVVTDDQSPTYRLVYSITYFNSQGTTLSRAQSDQASRIDISVSGYETIDTVRYSYSNTNLSFNDLGGGIWSLSGSGNIGGNDGTSYAMTISSLLISESTLEPSGGTISIAGNDGSDQVDVTVTFQSGSDPLIEVRRSGEVVSSNSVALPSVTVNGGATSFNLNSAALTHPLIGDMLDGKEKTFSGSLTYNGTTEPFSLSFQKSSTV